MGFGNYPFLHRKIPIKKASDLALALTLTNNQAFRRACGVLIGMLILEGQTKEEANENKLFEIDVNS